MYNKYFYGFEKEGKSAYYLANEVHGHHFNFRYPFNEDLIAVTLPKILNVALIQSAFD